MNAPMPPADFGAHGVRQTPSGDTGLASAAAGEREGERMAFAGPGTKEGSTAGAFIPPQFRDGAFTPDLSVQDYSGNPRDSGGPVKPENAGNRTPSASPRFIPGAT